MIRLWVRNEEGRFEESEISPMEGHRYGVNQVEFSPNGELLASCSLDGSTILWDVGVCITYHHMVLNIGITHKFIRNVTYVRDSSAQLRKYHRIFFPLCLDLTISSLEF
jgi:WD40 repeat protein